MPVKPLPSAGRLRSLYDYDPETGRLTNRYNGRTLSRKKRLAVRINKEWFNGARIIWKWMTGEDPENLIDHINLDGTDNRWTNLRAATYSQNSHNRKAHHDSTSGLKGVKRIRPKWRKDVTWQAGIRVNGTFMHLGTYATPQEAHAAYCEASIRYFGEFHRV